jgi:CBS domain containing-hemolysin-like protein
VIFDCFNLLASAAPDPPKEVISGGKAALYIFGITFFLLLNAFFVASEFAIVKVRPSQIDAESKDDKVRNTTALRVVNHLDGYLSANQLGITIASLALGFLGEPFVYALVSPFLWMTGMSVWWIKAISFTLAILSFTFLHVVVGELVPKSVAIRRPLQTTLALAGPLHVFFKSAHWAIAILQWTANFIMRRIFRIEPMS